MCRFAPARSLAVSPLLLVAATAKGAIGWEDSRLHLQYSLLSIGDNFRGDIGFVRRTGVRKHFLDAGFDRRRDRSQPTAVEIGLVVKYTHMVSF